jgi:26S proteasome regulatory subunit N13
VAATPAPAAAAAVPAATTAAAAKPATAVPATPVSTGAAATAASAGSDDASSKKMQFSEFQSILGNIAQSSSRSDLDLSEVLSLDVMAPILANKQIQEKLVQHLPDSEILPKTEFELRQTLTTPQFKKAMSSFSAALQSGQLGPLLAQFNLPEQVCAAAAQGNLEAFARAMEEHAAANKAAEKKDNDEMDTK